jgi:hypothetical protein
VVEEELELDYKPYVVVTSTMKDVQTTAQKLGLRADLAYLWDDNQVLEGVCVCACARVCVHACVLACALACIFLCRPYARCEGGAWRKGVSVGGVEERRAWVT